MLELHFTFSTQLFFFFFASKIYCLAGQHGITIPLVILSVQSRISWDKEVLWKTHQLSPSLQRIFWPGKQTESYDCSHKWCTKTGKPTHKNDHIAFLRTKQWGTMETLFRRIKLLSFLRFTQNIRVSDHTHLARFHLPFNYAQSSHILRNNPHHITLGS